MTCEPSEFENCPICEDINTFVDKKIKKLNEEYEAGIVMVKAKHAEELLKLKMEHENEVSVVIENGVSNIVDFESRFRI